MPIKDHIHILVEAGFGVNSESQHSIQAEDFVSPRGESLVIFTVRAAVSEELMFTSMDLERCVEVFLRDY